MTGSQQEFEDRIRRVLGQAARELPVRPVAWRAPSPTRRRIRHPSAGSVVAIASVLVVVIIAAGALVMLGRQHHHQGASPSTQGPLPGAGPLPPAPPAAFEPQLPRRDNRYIDAAWRATVRRDPACNGTHGQQLTTGSPSPLLTSWFAILRHPATPAARLRSLLTSSQFGPPPGNLPPGVQISKQELYVNQIRKARSAFGATFYVIPAGNVTGQRGVPARCSGEQLAAITHQIAHLPRGRQTEILTAQQRYLAYGRYQALHPEGVCATFVPAGAHQLDLADNLGCATLADFGRWGVLADADAILPRAAVFWTVVPDAVAKVTWQFAGGTAGTTQAVSITAHPVNNVAVARAPFARNRSGFPSTITLHDAHGRLIKQIKVTPNMITLCGYGC